MHFVTDKEVMMAECEVGERSQMLDKKLLDREVPWDNIAEVYMPAHLEAIQKEWGSFSDYKCLRILEPGESSKILMAIARGQILGTRFVFRDKNASSRTTDKLPLLAKARLTE